MVTIQERMISSAMRMILDGSREVGLRFSGEDERFLLTLLGKYYNTEQL